VVLDLSQLRNVTLNDEVLMREVVAALVTDSSQQIEELRRAVAKGDPQACIRLAHNAYGACGNVGAVSMARLFGSLERHARDADLDHCQCTLDQLIVELEKLRHAAESI
jgi:HPt (histidine-containing phosphotransfer) domain-containing protein